jgi:hypothetical protein
MLEIHISDILINALIEDDLCGRLNDHLRRMGSIQAECPLEMSDGTDGDQCSSNFQPLY